MFSSLLMLAVAAAAVQLCPYSEMTVTGPVTLSDPNCTLQGMLFTGPSALLLIDLYHLSHAQSVACLVDLRVVETNFTDGAVMQIVGGPSRSVIVNLAIERCNFSDALLLFSDLFLGNGSSVSVAECTIVWSFIPSNIVMLLGGAQATLGPLVFAGSILLTNRSVLTVRSSSFEVDCTITASGIVSTGQVTIADQSAVTITQNVFSLTWTSNSNTKFGIASVGTLAVSSMSMLLLTRNRLRALQIPSCTGSWCTSSGIYLSEASIQAASLIRMEANYIHVYSYAAWNNLGFSINSISSASESALIISGNTIQINAPSGTSTYMYGVSLSGSLQLNGSSLLAIDGNDISGFAGTQFLSICPQSFSVSLVNSVLRIAQNRFGGSAGSMCNAIEIYAAYFTISQKSTILISSNDVLCTTNVFQLGLGPAGPSSITVSSDSVFAFDNNTLSLGGQQIYLNNGNWIALSPSSQVLGRCNNPTAIGYSSGGQLSPDECSTVMDCWGPNTAGVSGTAPSACICSCSTASSDSQCIPLQLAAALSVEPPIASSSAYPLCRDETPTPQATLTQTPSPTVHPSIRLDHMWVVREPPLRRAAVVELVLYIESRFISPIDPLSRMRMHISVKLTPRGLLAPRTNSPECQWNSNTNVTCLVRLGATGSTKVMVPMVLGLNATDWGSDAAANVQAVVVNWTHAVESAWVPDPPNVTLALQGPVAVLSGGRTVSAHLKVTGTHPAMNALHNGTTLTIYGRGLDLLPAVLPIGPVLCNTRVQNWQNTTATAVVAWPLSLENNVDWSWGTAPGVVTGLLAAYAGQAWAEYFVSTCLTESSAAAIAAVVLQGFFL